MNTGYVLIVDDDPDAREIQIDLVQSLGLETRVAEDGVEALRIVQEQPTALILLDIMMPKMNGFAVLARLRSMPRTRRIPVIIVTACSLNDRVTLMLPGVVEVVPKGGFSAESMMRLITHTLQLESGPARPDTAAAPKPETVNPL